MATQDKKTPSKPKAKRSRIPKAGATVKVPQPAQIASDVWLEIGDIWLERNPNIEDEVTIRQANTTKVKQSG